jgi:CheY-like chemotaxis protein
MAQPDQGEPLAGLDRVLDRLMTVLQAHQPYTLDGAVREHVEVAIEAAMAAAGRARETPFVRDQAQTQIHEASTVAADLLEELRATHRQSGAIVERSLALRRKAIHLTASALTLARQAERLRAVSESRGEGRRGTGAGALHGIRILLVGDSMGPEASFEMLLSALGADVHGAASVVEAVRVARTLHPEVLVCDMPLPAAEGLICELRRRGVIAPALAVGPAADAATRSAGRAAGFANVLVRPVTPTLLVRAVRSALGA